MPGERKKREGELLPLPLTPTTPPSRGARPGRRPGGGAGRRRPPARGVAPATPQERKERGGCCPLSRERKRGLLPPPQTTHRGATLAPLAAHDRRHSTGGAQDWGGAGHPKEEGAAAPSTQEHRGPGGPLAEPKAAGVTPAAVNPRRGCQRMEEESAVMVVAVAESWRRKKWEEKKKKERKKEMEREGKRWLEIGASSPASRWPEVVAGVGWFG